MNYHSTSREDCPAVKVEGVILFCVVHFTNIDIHMIMLIMSCQGDVLIVGKRFDFCRLIGIKLIRQIQEKLLRL